MSLSAIASAAPYETKTTGASNVGAYQATLEGGWRGIPSEEGWYQVLYGETSEYGLESEIGKIYPSMEGWEYRSVVVKGLKPETTYHFVFGTNNMSGEEGFGGDLTFTTKSVPSFEASQYAATVTATELASQPMLLTIDNQTLDCAAVGASGTMNAATSSLKLTPTFTGPCKFLQSGWENATVAVNGCQFVYHPGDSGSSTTTMDVACPAGKAIEITAGTCAATISTQTNVGAITATGVTATNPDTVNLSYSASGLDYVKTKDGLGCPYNGTGAGSNGTIAGGQALSAKNLFGTPVDLKIGY